MSRSTRTLAGMAVGLSGAGSSALPRAGISRAAAADEKASTEGLRIVKDGGETAYLIQLDDHEVPCAVIPARLNA